MMQQELLTDCIAQKQIPLCRLEQMRNEVVGHVHPKRQAVSIVEGLTDVVHHQLCQGC